MARRQERELTSEQELPELLPHLCSPFMVSSARANELVPVRHNTANAQRSIYARDTSASMDVKFRTWLGQLQRRMTYMACQAAALVRHGPFAHQQASMWPGQKSSQNRLLDL
jgi:hypothetical protein